MRAILCFFYGHKPSRHVFVREHMNEWPICTRCKGVVR